MGTTRSTFSYWLEQKANIFFLEGMIVEKVAGLESKLLSRACKENLLKSVS